MSLSSRRCLALVLVLLALVTARGSAFAQDDPEDLLLSAEALGDGWEETDVPAGFEPGELFDDFEMSAYTGPGGSRLVTGVFILPGSVRGDADAVALVEQWANRSYSYTAQGGEDVLYPEDLAELDPPDGCDEAFRAEGDSYLDGFPTGATMCVVGDDLILFAHFSGELKIDDGTLRYHFASDAVVSGMLGEGLLAAAD